MKRIRLEKIASVVTGLELSSHAVLGTTIPARAGTVIAARVLNAKSKYNALEDPHGRMVPLYPGDVIAGALGRREALFGYSGTVPAKVEVGDTLQLLNLGGVIGTGAAVSPTHGPPFELEVLGSVLEFPMLETRVGRPACIEQAALPARPLATDLPPIVALVGTCMDSGKTTAAAALIGGLVHEGKRVAAGKLTGVSLRRDALQMSDAGAQTIATFTDFGVVTTDEHNAVGAAHSLVTHLAESEPDLIVLELGDGLLGPYGVAKLLADPGLSKAFSSIVLCAQDPVGAWGALQLLKETYGMSVDVVSGRVTDTPVGRDYCTNELGVPPANALSAPNELSTAVLAALEKRALDPEVVS